MSAILEIPPRAAEPVISVDRYHALIESGVLSGDDRVELIHGRLVRKMAKSPLHETTSRACLEAVAARLPAGWFIAIQPPLTMRDSEPEPDLMVIRGSFRDYLKRHPRPEDIALVIEIAHSTLKTDREVKRRLYASAGIPCYWIANLVDFRIEVYSDPANGDYSVRRDYASGEAIPLFIGGTEIATVPVADFLPKE